MQNRGFFRRLYARLGLGAQWTKIAEMQRRRVGHSLRRARRCLKRAAHAQERRFSAATLTPNTANAVPRLGLEGLGVLSMYAACTASVGGQAHRAACCARRDVEESDEQQAMELAPTRTETVWRAPLVNVPAPPQEHR